MSITVTHTTRTAPPKIPYTQIANTIAGKTYDLSVVFVGEYKAQQLNKVHRNKSYIPNVLSFPLNKTMGEIFICPKVAKRQAKDFGLSYTNYVTYLLIHGILHLKGYDHGDTMDKLERKYLAAFSTR